MQLVAPVLTVILGGGTTAHAVAGALPQNHGRPVEHPMIDVFVLGGRMSKQSISIMGARPP